MKVSQVNSAVSIEDFYNKKVKKLIARNLSRNLSAIPLIFGILGPKFSLHIYQSCISTQTQIHPDEEVPLPVLTVEE